MLTETFQVPEAAAVLPEGSATITLALQE